jgi:hypothetical protein
MYKRKYIQIYISCEHNESENNFTFTLSPHTYIHTHIHTQCTGIVIFLTTTINLTTMTTIRQNNTNITVFSSHYLKKRKEKKINYNNLKFVNHTHLSMHHTRSRDKTCYVVLFHVSISWFMASLTVCILLCKANNRTWKGVLSRTPRRKLIKQKHETYKKCYYSLFWFLIGNALKVNCASIKVVIPYMLSN